MSEPFGGGGFGSPTPFSAAPFFTAKTLIDEILRGTNHRNPETETSKRLSVLTFINNRYARVIGNKHWSWLYTTKDVNVQPPMTLSNLTTTQGSNLITGPGGSNFSVILLPYHKLVIRDRVHTIARVISDTEIELESQYSDASEALVSAQVIRPVFRLPSDFDHMRSMLIDTHGELDPLGMQELRRKSQYDPAQTGIPRWYALHKRDAQNQLQYCEVWPAPDEIYNVKLDYGILASPLTDSADCYPLIPDRYRSVLYYGGLAEMYRFLRDPVNADAAEKNFMSIWMQMQNDTQLTDSRYILEPARNYKNRGRRRHMRTSMDRSDFGRDG